MKAHITCRSRLSRIGKTVLLYQMNYEQQCILNHSIILRGFPKTYLSGDQYFKNITLDAYDSICVRLGKVEKTHSQRV